MEISDNIFSSCEGNLGPGIRIISSFSLLNSEMI